MPSHLMDQRHLSSLFMPSVPSSLFSEESGLHSERQLGFRKAESMPENSGLEEMSLTGGKSFSSSPLEKLHSMGGNFTNFLESPRSFLSKGQKARTSAGNNFFGADSPSNLSVTCLGPSNQEILSQANAFKQLAPNSFHYENSLFSSSLSETFGKSVLLSNDAHFGKSVDAKESKFVEYEPLESLKEIEAQTIGDLLPNDDDLLSGVIDDIECVAQPNSGDEDDLFCSGGGMELESDVSFNSNRASDFVRGVASSCQLGLNGNNAGEFFYGKQTSRTLLVRNIKSNVDDAELKNLFQQFGDIRRLHTRGKNQGFILVSYYDIRSARNAIQDRLLRQLQIVLNYYFPKDNSLEQDINNDTLIIFNLDSSVSNEDIRQIFGSYGEIKEIFHDPRNQNQRAIEFYDVRAAEAAFYALNMREIAGKRIKIELGCPDAEWQCLGKHSSLELELEGSTIGMNGGSPSNSVLDIGASSRTIAYGINSSAGCDSGSIQNSALQTLISPFMESKFPGISSTASRSVSSPIRVTMVGNHGSQSNLDELSHSLGQVNFGFQSMPAFHPHSLPEFHNGPINNIPFNTILGTNINSRIADGIDSHPNRHGACHINSPSFEHKDGKAISPINGHQYFQSNSNINFHHSPGSLMWQNSPSFVNNIPAPPPQQLHGLPRGPSHIMNSIVPLHHHHVGSAPALNPPLWGRRPSYAGDCMEAPSSFHPGSLGNMGFSGSSQMHPFGISSHNIYPHDCRNCIDPASAHVGSPSPQQRSHILHGRNSLNSAAASYDSSVERIRSRRCDSSATQPDNKKQFDLDINRIIRGEDSRTTLMIKNIPNKYTSKMLLATIDEHHKGTYDFIYLPIDFKNKCNVGYAFINLNDPKHIIPFHQAFNGKKWEKFNSEKVASLAYARIQGKAALIAHFQNSSLMNEDKRCRPILFHSDGPNAGDQEPFPMGTHIRSRPGRSRSTNNNEDQNPISPPDCGNGDDLSNNSTDSSSSFTKD